MKQKVRGLRLALFAIQAEKDSQLSFVNGQLSSVNSSTVNNQLLTKKQPTINYQFSSSFTLIPWRL